MKLTKKVERNRDKSERFIKYKYREIIYKYKLIHSHTQKVKFMNHLTTNFYFVVNFLFYKIK